jgi:hypothetical protein
MACNVPLSRKRRYFVLRKDIRSLCYYASREDLTLLGSIPLDIDTKLANVKPDDAGKDCHFSSVNYRLHVSI